MTETLLLTEAQTPVIPRPGTGGLNPTAGVYRLRFAESLQDLEAAYRLRFRAYLSPGANLCGRPARDREFQTIDFLTLLDLESRSSCARSRFLF